MGAQTSRWLTVLGAIAVLALVLFGVRWLKAPTPPVPVTEPVEVIVEAPTTQTEPEPKLQQAQSDTVSPGGGASLIAGALKRGAGDQAIGDGLALYMTHCSSCHGRKLQGQANWQTPNADGSLKAPPHDDSGHTWHHEDELLFNYTKLGGQALMAKSGIENFNSAMPGFEKTLTDDQIHQILRFIKSRWSVASRKAQRQRTAAWEQMTRRKPN